MTMAKPIHFFVACAPSAKAVTVAVAHKKRLHKAGVFLTLTVLDGVAAGFAGTDTHNLLQRCDKNLAVTDFARIGRLADGLNHTV